MTMKNLRYLITLTLALLLLPLNMTRSQPVQGLPSIALRPDEIRLDGRVHIVDAAGGNFVLRASSFTTSAGRSRMIEPVKTKLVRVTGGTSFFNGQAPRQRLSLSGLQRETFVTVVGTNLGDGTALTARLVMLQPRAGQRAATLASNGKPGVSSGRFQVLVGGRSCSGTLVQVHLDSVRIKVGLGNNRVGGTESLASMARRHGALAGINGSYFQAYNSGSYKPPVMTLITNGRPVFTGNIGTTLGFTAENEVRMDRAEDVLGALPGGSYRYSASQQYSSDAVANFWPRVQEAVGCGPRLVTDGRVVLDMVGEKFRDPKVLRMSTARSAVGVTRDRRLLLVTTSGTIPQLAGIMKALGAYQAMNLDGGASSGLWLRGSYLRSPGRNLSNCLLVLPR